MTTNNPTHAECPFCKRFHQAFRNAQGVFSDSIALVLVHFPLIQHKFARGATRAAVCAAEQGRFSEYADALFAAQDSLGLKTWAQYAADASGIDEVRLKECVDNPSSDAAVEAGLEAGERFGVQYTPTVMINGWQHSVPPTEKQLVEAVRGIVLAQSVGVVGAQPLLR